MRSPRSTRNIRYDKPIACTLAGSAVWRPQDANQSSGRIPSQDDGAVRRASAESPGRPFSFTSPRLVDMLKQRVRNRLAVRPGRRHPGGKVPDLSGEVRLSFGNQYLADCPPTLFDLLSGLEELGLTGFDSQIALN